MQLRGGWEPHVEGRHPGLGLAVVPAKSAKELQEAGSAESVPEPAARKLRSRTWHAAGGLSLCEATGGSPPSWALRRGNAAAGVTLPLLPQWEED